MSNLKLGWPHESEGSHFFNVDVSRESFKEGAGFSTCLLPLSFVLVF